MRTLIHRIQDAYRRYRLVAAYAVLGASIGALGVATRSSSVQVPETTPLDQTHATTTEQIVAALAEPLTTSTPVRLHIPRLDIDAPFERPLTLNVDGSVGVPEAFDTVGWYSGSPTPGSLGASVVLGHIDSYKGPAVFFYLGQLKPGDRFTIERADGSRPEFVVEQLERYPQDAFPTEKVYGPIDYAGIRLITCSGTYDHGSRRYSHNLVVYGRLVSNENAE